MKVIPSVWARSRRPKRIYLPFAAFLADLPQEVERLDVTLEEMEGLLGGPLPRSARFPFWWSNDESKTHARAWLTAGWRVIDIDLEQKRISFERTQGKRRG